MQKKNPVKVLSDCNMNREIVKTVQSIILDPSSLSAEVNIYIYIYHKNTYFIDDLEETKRAERDKLSKYILFFSL
jgi:hypothetical protein